MISAAAFYKALLGPRILRESTLLQAGKSRHCQQWLLPAVLIAAILSLTLPFPYLPAEQYTNATNVLTKQLQFTQNLLVERAQRAWKHGRACLPAVQGTRPQTQVILRQPSLRCVGTPHPGHSCAWKQQEVILLPDLHHCVREAVCSLPGFFGTEAFITSGQASMLSNADCSYERSCCPTRHRASDPPVPGGDLAAEAELPWQRDILELMQHAMQDRAIDKAMQSTFPVATRPLPTARGACKQAICTWSKHVHSR